jgi:2'-5' RNA ligase
VRDDSIAHMDDRPVATTMVAGPASSFTDGQLDQMASTAAGLLAGTPPITVSLGRVLYHPEAIVLAVSPGERLAAVRDAALAATRLVTGHDAVPEEYQRWIPHVTICYSTARQPAAPLIAALGENLPRHQVQVSSLSLIIQRGPERLWDWMTVATIPFAATATRVNAG